MVPVAARPNFHFWMARHVRRRDRRRKVVISLHLVTAVIVCCCDSVTEEADGAEGGGRTFGYRDVLEKKKIRS